MFWGRNVTRLTRETSLKILLISIIRRQYSSNNFEVLSNILNTIPKETDPNAWRRARHQPHVQLTENKNPAKQIYLQVIGNGAEGSPRCLYVFTDQTKYMFNCSEAVQRMSMEYNCKFGKLNDVFFTHRSWDNFGGLPGFVLTLQNYYYTQKVTLHGPEGISKLFAIAKGFLVTNYIDIREKNLAEKEHVDEVMRVKYVPFYGKYRDNSALRESVELVSQSGFEPIDDCHIRVDGRFIRSIEGNISTLPTMAKKCKVSNIASLLENRDICVAYICQPTTGSTGQISFEKLQDLGIKRESLLPPLREQLLDGNDITLPNGIVIKSSDVVNPPDPCPVFIVIECPSEDFLDSLLEKPEFLKHQKDAEDESDMAALVVHFTSVNIINSKKYQQWLNRFPLTTQHLFLNEKNNSLSSVSVHRVQHQLHLINANVFPLLKENCSRIPDNTFNPDDRFINPQTLLKYHLRPFDKIDTARVVDADVERFVSTCMNWWKVRGVSHLLHKPRKIKEENAKSRYPEILFLGTGSSSPSSARNTSGILIHLTNDKSLLLDCSEGTYLQMYRFYGSDAIDDELLKIKAIYISHLHVDHHMGLIGLLQKRKKAAIRRGAELLPVVLFAPQQIMWWLQRYHEMYEPITNEIRLVPNAAFLPRTLPSGPEYESVLQELELKNVDTAFARHCRHAFCVAFTHNNGWKLVYSGDTMPTAEILKIGQNCDLLIHEATVGDEFQADAEKKRHSTTSQAIEQGRAMNAKFTLLTHFSNGCGQVPRIIPSTTNNNVGIAFDNLCVSLADLHQLSLLVPALKVLFVPEFKRKSSQMQSNPISNFRHLNRN